MLHLEHEFGTEAEANAFADGIRFVNDSAIEVGGIQHRDGKYFVTTIDTDADEDDQPKITAIDREIKCGSCTLTALLNDGSTRKLFSYYIDELFFSDADLIGLTEDEAHQLRRDRDVAYLRS